MSLFPGVVEGTVEVEGVRVPYYDSATENGYDEPVVLLHGTAGTAATSFSTIYPLFAMQRRVVALDLTLPAPDTLVTIEHYVEQVVAVVAQIQPARGIHLVGHSLGAVTAAAVAARLGVRVLSLTLVSGWAKTNRSQLLRNTAWQALAAAGLSEIAEFTVYTGYSPIHLESLAPDAFDAWIERARGLWTNPDLPRVMELNRRVDLTAQLDSITAPTLIIACAYDQMVPPLHSKELFGAIADARYMEIGSGHAVVQERPIELYFLIEEFIADPSKAAAGSILQTGELTPTFQAS